MRLLKLIPDNTNIHFLKWKYVATAISLFLVFGSLALVAFRGLNLGVDFKGGITTTVRFEAAPHLDQLRTQVNGLGLGNASIQTLSSNRDVAIRLPFQEGGEKAQQVALGKLRTALDAKYGKGVSVRSVSTVGGKVGNELRLSAIKSALFGMGLIALYIWFRFEWQFGLGALLSLVHDVSITVGFFALTQMEFNLTIVAAVLTTIGYSLNDTIVVYDRIRENLRKYRKMDMEQLLDLSVNETLSRTIMTSLSLIITLTALLILGGEVIRGFTAAMLLGVFVGTYSSIYIAAPMLIWMKISRDSFLSAGETAKLKNTV